MKRYLPTVLWLALAALGCQGTIGGGSAGSGGGDRDSGPRGPGSNPDGGSGGPGTATCTDGTAVAPTLPRRIRRLTKLEIRNTVADLFGVTAANLTDEIEADPRPQGYSTGDERSVNPAYMDTLQHVALQIAADFRKMFDKAKFDVSCFTSDTSARDCADTFVRDLGKRAFRRALTDVDASALLGVYDVGRATGTDGDVADRFAAGLQYTVMAVVQSPAFIFRTELGDDSDPSSAVVHLTQAELASAISYGIVASPPDKALVSAAEAGQLATPEQLATQVHRVIDAQPERFKAQVQRFLLDWLGIDFDKPDWANKDKTLYPKFSSAVKDALRQETGMFMDDWTSSGPFLPTLLTSPRTFINQTNAPIYGLTAAGTTFQKQALDPKQRAGILTSPGFLGTYAHIDSSSPVFRAVAIMRKLLCHEPPPVPAMVPPLPPISNTDIKTTRQRFDQHTSVAFCHNCHGTFDPMGDVFESYDAVGAYRTEENGIPIDASGGIVGTASSDAKFDNAVDMIKALAVSPEVHECFVRQVVRFSVGRIETEADQCAIQNFTRAFTEKSFDLRELLATVVSSPAFAVRSAAP